MQGSSAGNRCWSGRGRRLATEHSDIRSSSSPTTRKPWRWIWRAPASLRRLPAADDAGPVAGPHQLRIATPDAAIRLAILTPAQRRSRPRRDDEPRLSTAAVAALLAGG